MTHWSQFTTKYQPRIPELCIKYPPCT